MALVCERAGVRVRVRVRVSTSGFEGVWLDTACSLMAMRFVVLLPRSAAMSSTSSWGEGTFGG